MRSLLPLALVSLCLAATLASPGCDAPSYPPYDRGALLMDATDQVILPGLSDAATQSASLHTATSALCAAPSSAGLTAAQAAWRSAFLAWQSTLPYQFGPARTMNLGPEVSTWPTSETAIEANVAATDTIDAHYVDALGAGSKGFYALEYLLFAYPSYAGPDDAMTLAALGDARRCQYADALADHLERVTTQLESTWTTSFAATFTGAGSSGNATYSSQQGAVNDLVSQVRDAIERTKVDRLGKPIGRVVGAGPVESPYAHASVASMEAILAGAEEVWTTGTHCPDAFLRTRNSGLADDLLASFTSSRTGLAALESPPLTPEFESYVSGGDHTAANTAYDALGDLEQSIAGDVASTLGLSIVSAIDGD